jgi:phage terminase large subunit
MVNADCKNTVMEFPSYVWDKKAQDRGEDKPVKVNDHCVDMVRYGLFTHFWHPQIASQYTGMNFN